MRLSTNRIKEANAGELVHAISILQPTATTDFEGGEVVTFAEVKKVYANIEPKINSRVLEEEQIKFNQAAKIIVRYDPAINVSCKIDFEGEKYIIHSIVDIGYGNRYMELLAYTTNG
jgi:SPP1 family predicted phage head-tail adaptor